MRRIFLLAVIGGLLGLGGCKPVQSGLPRYAPAPAVMPTYAELVARYNANVARLGSLWARAVVELTWIDEEGDRHSEQGDDSQLFIVLPDRMALSIGKVGQMGLWAGMDGERYWYFDTHEAEKAYVGRHEHVGKPCAEPPPLGMTPRHVLAVLGLVRLPSAASGAAPVAWDRGAFRVVTPDRRFWLWLDPQTAYPQRIELVGARGELIVAAELSDYRKAEVRDVPPNHQGQVPARVEIVLPRAGSAGSGSVQEWGRLVVKLSNPQGASSRIRPRLFQFEKLVESLKPREIVVLDAGCE